MCNLEKEILKSMYSLHKNKPTELTIKCTDDNYSVKLPIKSDIDFSYLKVIKKSDEEVVVNLPSDEEFNQFISNLDGSEVKQYHELESMLSKTQLKIAVGLAFIH